MELNLINSGGEITRTNYEALLSDFFENNETISLGNRTLPEITKYIDRTINPDNLGVFLLEGKLIERHQYAELCAKLTDNAKNTYLYIGLLDIKVETREQYLNFFIALFKSGNDNVAQTLFKALKRFQSNQSAWENTANPSDFVSIDIPAAYENTANNNIPLLQDGHHAAETSFERTGLTPRTTKRLKYTFRFAVVISSCIVGLGLLYLIHTRFTSNDERLSALLLTRTQTAPEPQPANLLPETPKAKDVQFTTASSAPTKTTVHPQQSNEPARESQLHNSQPRGQSNVTSLPSPEPLLMKNETGQQSPKAVSSSPGIYNQQSGIVSLPKNEIALTIGSPKDMPPLPIGAKVSLTLNDITGADWVNWSPPNAGQIVSLTLASTFSPLQILHLVFTMKNLTTLKFENLTGKLCGRVFNTTSKPLFHDNLEYLGITHVEDSPCRSAYQFFKDAFDFPKLRRVEIVNLPISLENEKYLLEFFKKLEPQLNQLDLQNVVVHMESQAFGNLVFKNLTSLYAVFREPYSVGAKSVFTNLNKASPNLMEISTNIVCTPGERCVFDKNWPMINSEQRLICDVSKVKESSSLIC
ncbi:unnamed protein product [Allacma fusca]|uniref:Uncharacterized protein n=1 Tax=Allacma fusca TaxID=39272 RepID=A0A8J2NU63_9HEXA|nr:unnamed protein product [Allacma fusca]